MMRSRTQLSLLMVASSAILLAAPAVQAQQNKAAVDKIVQLNKAALEDFDTLEFESAKKNLQQALAEAKKHKLDKHPVTARTYLHLGVVHVTGFKDRAQGEQAFAAALAILPSITIEKSLMTSELGEVFKSAKAGGGKASRPAPAAAAAPGIAMETPAGAEEAASPDDEPDLPARIEALDCPFPDEAPTGKDIVLRCAAAPALNVDKAVLFYRPQDKQDFLPITMEISRKGWWTATIPGSDVTGKSLQFYFEARNAKDKPVASNGRADSPNVFSLRDKAKRVRAGVASSGGNKAAARAAAAKSEIDRICEENPVDERCLDAKRKRKEQEKMAAYKYWFSLAIGNHLGLIFGDLESRTDLKDFNKGFSVDPYTWHVSPEIGIKLSPRFAIAIQSRHQYVYNPAKFENRVARGAHAAMLRAILFLNPPKQMSEDAEEAPPPPSATQWYLSANVGGGEGFRLTLIPDNDPVVNEMRDTSLGGPIIFGPGAGFMHEWTPGFGFTMGANLLLGAPKFNVALDLNVGLFFGVDGKKKVERAHGPDDDEPRDSSNNEDE